MKKILLVIQREYLTRVRKRSFIVMTILGPILMASAFVVPMYLATLTDEEKKVIEVLDETGWFYNAFSDTGEFEFKYTVSALETAKFELMASDEFALLYIPRREMTVPSSAVLYSLRQPGVDLKGYIRNVMSKEVESQKLRINLDEMDLSPEDRERAMQLPELIKTSITLSTMKMDESGQEEETFTEVLMAIAFVSGMIIYMFIFIFGAQVLRGVMEEKTSRIIEVMVSSVRPFQLMMGKIIGIAMVGLTQFLLWIVLTFAIVSIFQIAFADQMPGPDVRMAVTQSTDISNQAAVAGNAQVAKVFEIVDSINYSVILISFLFFFLGGYLLYAALFAAIGSAVDSETDTQQFMMPVTIPLFLGFIIANVAVYNPDGQLAFWFSMIPFTSPIVMMARIPFGVPIEQIWISGILLILGFIFTTWLAARIYRVGILMYGKKVSYGELWKWITYKS
ncbi:MAG: ABC transporter permease [Bacteroidetes bacterium]|nr:MAG: ABC transporter permease [Bacteroidota bacterium]